MEQLIWSGHVKIVVDGKAKKIVYQADGAIETKTYTPDGWMENKAVNGLVEKLQS